MGPLESLAALARYTAAGGDPLPALYQAIPIVRSMVGREGVRVTTGDGTSVQAYPPFEGENPLRHLEPGALVRAHIQLMKLARAGVVRFSGDGSLEVFPADGSHGGDHLAMVLSTGDGGGEELVAEGGWTAEEARDAAVLLEAAAPALAIIFGRVVDNRRSDRAHQQLQALSGVAHVFTRAKKMPEVLQELAGTINSATGLLVMLDVLDGRGRITIRSISAAGFRGTPLDSLWRRMKRAPDPIRDMIFQSHRYVLLPDLQVDPRISEPARDLYRRAALVSGATFPLIFEDEVVGLMRIGSMKPTVFEPETVLLLQALADQAAVVVKGVQLWDELQRSRRETERYASRLQASMEIQHHLARTDPLCGIPNRRYLDEVVAAECARAARYGSHLSVAMADLDYFKDVNDRYGHDVGDVVLRQVAVTARANCRKVDVVGRLGGDEFLFVLPATPLRRAMTWADRFRQVLEETPLGPPGAEAVHTTVSLGLAEADAECVADPSVLLRRCDEALYAAKSAGRNQIRPYRPRLAAAV